jgi:hypothetical protein
MTNLRAELEVSDTDPVALLSNSIATHVEKLLGNKYIIPNTWNSIEIVSDSYLDSSYESETLKSKYKEKSLIHNQLVYYAGLDESINYIKTILEEKLGYSLSTSKYLVELHIANSTDYKVKPPFEIHEDDFGGIDCKVCTGIFYITNTCEGGDLNFYDIHDNITKQIKTQANKFVAFKGDEIHSATGIFNGTRIAVSYQLERIE